MVEGGGEVTWKGWEKGQAPDSNIQRTIVRQQLERAARTINGPWTEVGNRSSPVHLAKNKGMGGMHHRTRHPRACR